MSDAREGGRNEQRNGQQEQLIDNADWSPAYNVLHCITTPTEIRTADSKVPHTAARDRTRPMMLRTLGIHAHC